MNHNTYQIQIKQAKVGNDAIETVSAKELHGFLEVESKFADWITRRINEYGFQENQDFIIFLKNEKNSGAGRPSKEYHITLDMAKELSMIERTDKGKQARQYFIECEKIAKQQRVSVPAPAAAPAKYQELEEACKEETFYFYGKRIRTITYPDNLTWFVANDILNIIGLTRYHLKDMTKEMKRFASLTFRKGKSAMTVISINAILHLIGYENNAPQARELADLCSGIFFSDKSRAEMRERYGTEQSSASRKEIVKAINRTACYLGNIGDYIVTTYDVITFLAVERGYKPKESVSAKLASDKAKAEEHYRMLKNGITPPITHAEAQKSVNNIAFYLREIGEVITNMYGHFISLSDKLGCNPAKDAHLVQCGLDLNTLATSK